MSLPIPKRVPEPGFYYHYKHNPNGPVNDYAYEVVGVGFHTEDDARPGEGTLPHLPSFVRSISLQSFKGSGHFVPRRASTRNVDGGGHKGWFDLPTFPKDHRSKSHC